MTEFMTALQKAAAMLMMLLALLVPAVRAQRFRWQPIVDLPHSGEMPVEPLTPAERHALERAIVASSANADECSDEKDWPSRIIVHSVKPGSGRFSLAESGPGCLRGGQGSNGAMWLLQWHNGQPTVLGELDGWFDAIVPSQAHGLHDIAVGWHNSSEEYGLSLYRFDGRQYRDVDATTVRCGEAGCRALDRFGRFTPPVRSRRPRTSPHSRNTSTTSR